MNKAIRYFKEDLELDNQFKHALSVKFYELIQSHRLTVKRSSMGFKIAVKAYLNGIFAN